jgi:potassium-transporting ATPase potassium-binding subunit
MMAVLQLLLLLTLITLATVGIAAWVRRLYRWQDKAIHHRLGRHLGIDMATSHSTGGYLWGVVAVYTAVGAGVYLLSAYQGILPWNPQGLPSLSPLEALHTAISVASHTNWQPVAPERLSLLTLMLGVAGGSIAVGALGCAVGETLVRALRREAIGNLWASLIRWGLGAIYSAGGAAGDCFGFVRCARRF